MVPSSHIKKFWDSEGNNLSYLAWHFLLKEKYGIESMMPPDNERNYVIVDETKYSFFLLKFS